MLNRKIDQELLNAIITKAQEQFVPGATHYANGMNSPISYMIRRHSLGDKPSNINQDFHHYNADLVDNGSTHHLVAAVGPKLKQLPVFFQEVVANPRHPIKKIIALGKMLGHGDEKALDFHDYCLMAEPARYVVGDEFYDVSVDLDPKQNDSPFIICNTTVGEPTGAPLHTALSEGIVHSQLSVARGVTDSQGKERVLGLQTIQVTIIAHAAPAEHLSSDDEQLPKLLRLYQESLNHNTLIHCDNGMGRTGQLILTFEIFRQFDNIFATNFSRDKNEQAKFSAREILNVLNMLRRDRKGLVDSSDQLQHAIRSACALRQYQATLDLDKKGLEEPKTVRSHSAPSTFFGRLDRCYPLIKEGEDEVVKATLRPAKRM
jgi:protein tyrosine phosphatase